MTKPLDIKLHAILDDGGIVLTDHLGQEIFACTMEGREQFKDVALATAKKIAEAYNRDAVQILKNALLDIRLDLENNGEVFGTDEHRIERINQGLKEARLT